MSSDDEFERFLQGDSDDEHNALSKTKKKATKSKAKVAIVDTPATLIALDDSTDPYNFDMTIHAQSEEEDSPIKEKKKKTKKKETKEVPKKLSLEDRMAEILKRNGSSLVETLEKPKAVDIPPPKEDFKLTIAEEKEDDAKVENTSEASYSDSLGMESADFEVCFPIPSTLIRSKVGAYAKKNITAKQTKPNEFTLHQEHLHQANTADRFRYALDETELMPHAEEKHSESSADEAMPSVIESTPQVIQTTVPATLTAANAPVKSEFERMKELFSLSISNDIGNESYADDDFEEEPTVVSPIQAQTDPLDQYEDDEFEESDALPTSPPPPPPPPLVSVETSSPESPGPPPPPDTEFPMPPLTLGGNDDGNASVPASIPDVPPKSTVISFLDDESFEFKYDLKAKVETISLDPPTPSAPPQNVDATIDEKQTNEPKPSITPSTIQSAPTSHAVPHQQSSQQAPPPSEPARINPQEIAIEATNNIPLHAPSVLITTPTALFIRRDDIEAQLKSKNEMTQSNPIVSKFHSLQDQLNRTSFQDAPLHDSITQAFERDRYIIREFSNKENELKLQLQAAQREILALRHQVDALSTEQELHTLSDARLLGKFVAPSGGVQMTNQAWDAMRKGIETQETLLKGYQVENERLMHQLKEVKRDLQYDAHLNNKDLQATIKELRQQLEYNTHPVSSRTLESQLRTDAQIIDLQEELHRVKADSTTKERELKSQLDTLRKAKIELEYRMGGIRMETLAKENEAFDAMKAQYEQKLRDAQDEISALNSKVEWYIQNQQFIDDQALTVKQQAETIDLLKKQLTSYEKRPEKKQNRSPQDIRRIQTLESQLKDMEIAMRKRNPDSLVNLILASKPSNEELKATDQGLREIQKLQEEIKEMEKTYELKLTRFRQQHERVVQQLREASVKAKSSSDTSDVSRIRLYYQNKIKDLERKLEQRARQSDFQEKEQSLETPTTANTEKMDELRAKHLEEITNLKRQLDESENARRLLVDAFDGMGAASPPLSVPAQVESIPVAAQDEALKEQIAQLQTTLEQVGKAHTKSFHDAKEIWQEEIIRLTDMLFKSQAETQKMMEIAGRVPKLDETIAQLTHQLSIPNTPSMLQYQALEIQIQTLGQKHALREAELNVLLQQATKNSQVQVFQLQQQHEQIIARKNKQIESFQLQIQDILGELKLLQ